MSIELRHPLSDAPARRQASLGGSYFDAIAHGPFGYLKSIMLGFVVGCVLFLVAAVVTPELTYINAAPVLSICAGGAAVLFLFGAVVANYVIGSRIREEHEFARSKFAGGASPRRSPRPAVRRTGAAADNVEDRDTTRCAQQS